MKCNQSRPGFELMSPCPFPMTITTTPRANLVHLFIMWLMVSSLSPHNLQVLFCWLLSILAVVWMVSTYPLFTLCVIYWPLTEPSIKRCTCVNKRKKKRKQVGVMKEYRQVPAAVELVEDRNARVRISLQTEGCGHQRPSVEKPKPWCRRSAAMDKRKVGSI